MPDENEDKTADPMLSDLRKRAGLTQAEVADRLFLSTAQVRRIEAHYPHVMFNSLRAYLDVIGVDVKLSQDGFEDILSGNISPDPSHGDVLRTRRQDPTRRARWARPGD
ncbi:helix-turn-helix domain-containing protein [Streptomyces olivaceus]|uniref:helix-turn-helix domain-containing protein n=1 Tax=Streptomyces olivaceus TaxID=47716 RepID=UPI0036C86453